MLHPLRERVVLAQHDIGGGGPRESLRVARGGRAWWLKAPAFDEIVAVFDLKECPCLIGSIESARTVVLSAG
jgi:hypothetical protein